MAEFSDYRMRPDWRFYKVTLILNEGKQATRADDKFTRRCYAFLKKIKACKTKLDIIDVNRANPMMSAAYHIYTDQDKMKDKLEALLLCRDIELDKIAEDFGISEEAVNTYAKVFFDVREHLVNNPGFISTMIMKPALLSTLTDCRNTSFIWKFVAFEGGYDVVKGFWTYNLEDPRKFREFHKEAGINAMYRNFGLANFLRRVDGRESMFEVTEQTLKILEMELKENELRGNDDVRERGMVLKNIIQNTQFSVLAPSVEFNAATELTVQDRLRLALEAEEAKAQEEINGHQANRSQARATT